MAENSAAHKNTDNPGAVLHPGRAADPAPEAPESPTPATGSDDYPSGPAQPAEVEDVSEPAGDESGEESGEEADHDSEELEKSLAQSQQRKLRLLLRQCDRVMLMDFNLLSMSDWPDNFSMAAARRNRDLWIFSALVAASVFLSGLTGYVPAWLAGGGLGAFVIILLLGVPFIRRVYTDNPSYMDLVFKRQQLLRDARKHAAHLEGKEGLAWQCLRMADYNPTLRHRRFRPLTQLSEHRALTGWLTRRDRIRLYLIFMLEAEKAYNRAQEDFFAGHQKAIDRGWPSVAAETREPVAGEEPESAQDETEVEATPESERAEPSSKAT
ncbi:hypothetical protein SAMN05216429_103202 [Marinobacter persicus]|uniref:Uncharacterized protein n=1 Tax=Marinobacter persicus TaxID=930118 RepID=A0A1I3S7F5_9GAMM|nr:hypothetical protein [Marinobacter persicus]GHD44983.1 hypothetical protein GCM10008110_10510 [Marinobacter persicus]SFJ53539.1 hypothetical protein SAMN05216429_103202 [Marinobacter persicus]